MLEINYNNIIKKQEKAFWNKVREDKKRLLKTLTSISRINERFKERYVWNIGKVFVII